MPISPFENQPQFDEYIKPLLQDGFTHIPIMRETLADLDTPVSTYLKLADLPYTYLFESVQGGNKWGRYSIIGLPCDKRYRFRGNQLTIEQGRTSEIIELEEPLQKVRELQQQYKVAQYDGLPEMIGGLVGYFAYDTVAYIEPKLAEQDKPDSLQAEDILLLESKDVLVFDNLSGRIYLVTLAELNQPQAYQLAQQRLSNWEAQLSQTVQRKRNKQAHRELDEADFNHHFSHSQFKQAVETCKQYIRQGDIMQVVLSQRLSCPFDGSSFDIYRALRTINPSPYMYYLNLGDLEIVGSSPEILVRLEDETLTVRPIAGTRKRGKDEQKDQQLEAELLNDEKELAEHLMLIDLGRNDVGRVAKIGSVELTEKMGIERYSHVMHIVSNVQARLDKNYDAVDVLKATFPAGTVSGAPKVRAMQIIAELEPVKRGIYSGAVGYLSWNGNMDTAIAIRTIVIKDNTLYLQAGAGIVADSVAENEWQETLNKARALFSAVSMATAGL